MSCRILAICDTEPVYADLLTKQLLRMPEQDLQIRNFSSMEQLAAFAEVEEITFLVLAEPFLVQGKEIRAKVCCCLSTERIVSNGMEDVVYIFRYQTTEEIYQEICKNECAYQRIQATGLKREKPAWECIGVCNPVHRNGQTTFAKGMSSVLHTPSSRVLYLGLEQYAGICSNPDGREDDLDEELDLMDLLYHVKQKEDSVPFKLGQFTIKGIAYDYMNPMSMGQTIKTITLAEWLSLLKIIRESGLYEVLVLDVDSCLQGYIEILETCDRIFLPIREDMGGEEKLNQFEENLRVLKKEALKERMEYTYLPTFTALDQAEIQKNMEIFTARLLRRGY